MRKLKLQHFGHLAWRADSLEKTLMLGKTGGKRKGGWKRMRWLDNTTNSKDMNLSKLQEIAEGRGGAWRATVHGVAKSPVFFSSAIQWPGWSQFTSVPFCLRINFLCIQSTFAVAQSLNPVPLFGTLWSGARQASLSFTISQSLLKLMSIESVMTSNLLVLCHPLLSLPSIFPSIRVFSNELAEVAKLLELQLQQWIFRVDFL